MPLGHVGLTVSNLDASLAFYLAALAPLGYKVYKKGDTYAGLAVHAPDFWLHYCPSKEKKQDQQPPSGPAHVAFECDSHRTVDNFYEAALKAGAKCNGPPGYRPHYVPGYYAAYVRDPDGNNIECMYWNPWWLKMMKNAPVAIAAAVGAGAAWWAASF